MSSFKFLDDLLTFPRYADSTSGLTWGGQTYETSDGSVNGSLQVSTVDVKDGVNIQATEVVMLTFFDLKKTQARTQEGSAVRYFCHEISKTILSTVLIITLLTRT